MTKFTGCLLLLFLTFFSFAQIEVNSEATADQVIETLVGSGVEVSNVTINCPDVSYGTFNGSSNMGIGNGIIMTSGDAKLAEGPNNEKDASLNNFSWVEDEDLQALIPDYDIMDACVIEFDFIPAGDSLSFKYVFGSEEYPEFLEGDFNDVFGFFISGPGIEGDFSNGAKNVAVVPGTEMPVSIQTINNGPVKFDMENGVTLCDGPCVNCEYFMCNGNGDDFFNEPWFYEDTYIQYNGFTTILTAGIKLTPGEKYHIKLAIADAGDPTYDTGVFLEGKSFSTNVPQLAAYGVEGVDTFKNAAAGCTNGQFDFNFKEPVLCDVTIDFEVGGTSEAGVDYTAFANSILIPENSSSESILVEILDDGVVGDAKTLELYITGVSNEECANVILDTISLTIDDAPVFGVSDDVSIEKGDSADIEASGGWNYQWSGSFDDPTKPTQTVSPEETTDYEVTISYGRCSSTLATRVAVAGPVPPCELVVSSADVDMCNDYIYELNLTISGAALGDAISVTDRDGNLLGSFTYNNGPPVRIQPIPINQTVLTITNNTNAECAAIEFDTTEHVADCLNPDTCSISVTMGSIASCTRNAYDLQLMLTGEDNGDSFSVSTANGTDLGTYNYSDMPVLIADIPVDQTVLFIRDEMFANCTTQTIDIFPVVQACVNLVPQCTLIEVTPTVTDCTDSDFTLSLDVNTNSTGNSFRVSDNLGNNLGIYNYDDESVTIGSLSLDVTSLTITDSGNSECTTQTDDLTGAVETCQEDIPMCSLTVTSADVTSCTEENYTLQLNISGTDVGTSFSVSDASGNDLGTYNYADVPVDVSDIAISESVLTISDNDNEDCSANTDDLAMAIQACIDELPMGGGCSLSAATATFVDCTETDYSITLEVTGENTAASFTVSDASGNDLGTYNYADLAVEISGIAVAESVLTITDGNDVACSASTNDLATDIQTCLEPPVCAISAAMATINTCTDTEYSIVLGVMGENLGTSFTVTDGSGNDLGTYDYEDMPVEVTGIEVAESVLTITDSDNTDCSASTNDLATALEMCPLVEPTCNLSSVVAILSSCTETDYTAMIMVAGENTGTTFNITDAAGNDLGTYNYADSPIELSSLATTSSIFTITDGDDASCSATSNDLSTDIQDCVTVDPTCSVMAMAMLNTCTENDYTLGLVVSGQNTGDSFTVTNASGTDLGTYNYADSPIEISGVALTDEVFIITDSDDSMCVASTNNIAAEIQQCLTDLMPPSGECSVSYSDVSITECDDSTFSVEVSVIGMNAGATFKAVSLNGVSAGNFTYTDSPFQINNLPIDQNYLYFIDNDDKSCFALANLSDLINSCLSGDECTLDISAGFLTLDNDYVCDGDSPATNLIDTSLPQGYNTYYVFHNNVNLTPASLSNTQVYAVSNSDLNLENSLIPCGTPVYVTAMIAEQTLNIADVNLSAACTTYGNTVEIVFLCPISVYVEELCNQATGLFVLNVVVKGGLPAFETDTDFTISGDVYTGNSGNEELISIIDLPDGSDYNIVASDEYGCSTTVSGSITCEKKLPVELVTFTGEARQNGNLLKWITASEIANDFFTIEHSTDAVNYTKLTLIEGSGTINEATNYEFLDRTAANGTTYYRLSQTDFDGTSQVEGVVFITRGEDIGINIAGINPIPFVNELNIQLSSTDNVFVRFSLTDLAGRLMVRNEHNLINGLTEVSLDTEQLAIGIYMLRIETNTGSIVKKVVKH